MAASTSRNVGSASSAPSAGTASRRICAFRPGAGVTDDHCASSGSLTAGHRPRVAATRRIAATDRSTSCLGGRPVGHRDPHQPPAAPGGAAEPAGPVALHAFDHRVGAGVRPEADQHLVEHDVVDHLGAAGGQPSANRRASRQHRSTSSATPSRPSSRSAAQTAKPLARREDSSTKSDGEAPRRSRPGRTPCTTRPRRARPGARRTRSRSRTARSATCARRTPRSRPVRSRRPARGWSGWPPPTARTHRRRAPSRRAPARVGWPRRGRRTRRC